MFNSYPFFLHLVHTSAACLVSGFALLLLLLESIPCRVRKKRCTFHRAIKLSVHKQLSNSQAEKRRKNRFFFFIIILCTRDLGLLLVAVVDKQHARLDLHDLVFFVVLLPFYFFFQIHPVPLSSGNWPKCAFMWMN